MGGPKRAANIRKTFNLQKEDNVCSYVVRREAGKKKKAPKVQRLITKQRLQRKRKIRAETLKGIKATREARKEWVPRRAVQRRPQGQARAGGREEEGGGGEEEEGRVERS